MTAARVHTQLLLLSRLYLLLSLVLPEGIPPLGEVGQPQEVHHLPLSVDECREDGRVSEGAAVKVSKQHGGVRVKACSGSEPRLRVLDSKHHDVAHKPARGKTHAQHPDAFALTLIHQIVIFFHQLIRPVWSHFEPVVQPATAGLQEEKW